MHEKHALVKLALATCSRNQVQSQCAALHLSQMHANNALERPSGESLSFPDCVAQGKVMPPLLQYVSQLCLSDSMDCQNHVRILSDALCR
eukprot:scaffold78372_cov19-Prasinocladus_malaysianus.AAC.1